MRPPATTTVLMLVAAAVLLTWNGSRFVGAQRKVRTKDLEFLPSPLVARALCLGHHNTAAKLRWIDSFAYFELQLDRKDDTVTSTGESAFERLYRMLLALDPHFVPFYEHTSLNLGGVLDRHGVVLSLLNDGLLTLPHERGVWRMIASELRVNFKQEDVNPLGMDAFLAAWAAAEVDDAGRQMVWDWKKAMAQRQYRDLAQMPYWEEQLRLAKPGSDLQAFVIDTMREQLARYAEERLNHLHDTWYRTQRIPPVRITDLLEPSLLRDAFPDGIPPVEYFPIKLVAGVPSLRPDPFGYPYGLVGDRPISPGWEALRARKRSGMMTQRLEDLAKRDGRWPDTLEAAVAAGLELDALPRGCHWRLIDQVIRVEVDPPPMKPWTPITK